MKNEISNGLKVTTGVKAGGLSTVNHNGALKVATGVKAGGLSGLNHNRALSVG
ncbi:MAG: hypothetical protein JWM82_2945 [Myxococcales bacterium]|nr:hypothetical protein [Myxococcales bacterium]